MRFARSPAASLREGAAFEAIQGSVRLDRHAAARLAVTARGGVGKAMALPELEAVT
jgi:hypothetical protein